MRTPELLETALSPHLVVWTLAGDTPETSFGTNCVALAGGDATLLVDPLIAPAHARLVEAAVRRRGFPRVRHVALTHHHTDHALGAGWFAARGAIVHAHARCAAAMADQHASIVAARRLVPELAPLFGDAEPHAPAARFDREARIDLGGGVGAELRHLGAGHTPGDAIVVLPSEDAIAAGDLVFAGYHFNYEEADPGALPLRLDAVAALPQRRIIPGHGAPGGRELLDAQRAYHLAVAELVRKHPDADAAREAILARFPGHLLRPAVPTAVLAHASPGR